MLAGAIRRKMNGIVCGENDDVREHFEKLAQYYERLSALGTDLPDKEYLPILMTSLPPAYDSTIAFMMTATRLSKIEPDPDVLIQLVTDEYDTRLVKNRVKPKREAGSVAYYASGGGNEQSTSKYKGKNDRKGKKCHNCGKLG